MRRSIALSLLLAAGCKTPSPIVQGLLDCEASAVQAQIPAIETQVATDFATGQVDVAGVLDSLLKIEGPAVVCAVEQLVHDLDTAAGAQGHSIAINGVAVQANQTTQVKLTAWINSEGHAGMVKPSVRSGMAR